MTEPVDWANFADGYHLLLSPLQPGAEDVARTRAAIHGRDGRTLMLGVTPALAELGKWLIAVDASARMVAEIWPGDDHRRHALRADWLNLPISDAAMDAVIGDGSLNSVDDALPGLFLEVRRVLAPHGIAAFRLFCAPDQPETLEAIRQDIADGWVGNFHALKWRIAMALAAQDVDAIVAVETIRQTFDRLFPNRLALCKTTGWNRESVDTIDYYRGASHRICFPTIGFIRRVAMRAFSSVSVRPAQGYPLAERCPTIVLT
jgi:SAM-dependent methyltransferase